MTKGNTQLHRLADGPCATHPCDACTRCVGGRCCRQDNPEYQLPALGEWDGPISGELGALNDDGTHVECHACGRWFARLGKHILSAHDLTVEEYRAIFGLNLTTGLASTAHKDRLRAHARDLLSRGLLHRGNDVMQHRTPEQRSAIGSTSGQRLEFRRRQRTAASYERLVAANRTRDYRSDALRLQDAHARIRANPERHAEWRRKISAAHGGRVQRCCEVCRGTFETYPSRQRKVCSPACADVFNSRLFRHGADPEVLAMAVAWRRAGTHCVEGHQLDGANTIITAAGRRACRVCQRAANHRSRRRRLAEEGHPERDHAVGGGPSS